MVRISIASVLLAFVSVANGCPCDSGLPDLFADELRVSCDGAPCDWELSQGEVRDVPFLHAAEGALELSNQAVAARPIGALDVSAPLEEELAVSILARCDTATELRVEVSGDALREGEPVVPVYVAALVPGASTGGLPLPRHELTFALTDPLQGPSTGATVTLSRMTLRVVGPGRCTVRDLHLVSRNRFSCFG